MNAAAKGKKHAMELLEGLYRELAILGIVAFVLWSINVSDYVTIEVSHTSWWRCTGSFFLLRVGT